MAKYTKKPHWRESEVYGISVDYEPNRRVNIRAMRQDAVENARALVKKFSKSNQFESDTPWTWGEGKTDEMPKEKAIEVVKMARKIGGLTAYTFKKDFLGYFWDCNCKKNKRHEFLYTKENTKCTKCGKDISYVLKR